MNKEIRRKRRGKKAKLIQRQNLDRPRLVVSRSLDNIYATIVTAGEKGDIVLVTASSIGKELKTKLKGSRVEQAQQVGKVLGELAKAKNISAVAFDRAGYKYHGRVKALAEGAREAGLNF